MEIPLFVLVLQIGINAALNNYGYAIPSSRFVNSGQTRRLPEPYNFMSLSSRGLPESDEDTDSDYSNSFEEYSYRSVRPLKSRQNQRRNDYLSYHARPGYDEILEAAPVRRINLDNYAENLQTSSSRRSDPYHRRPYLRNRLSNLRPSQARQYYRKVNDDLSLEDLSLESSKLEDASLLGEKASNLRSLLSFIEQPSNRRSQNRKYFRQGNSLSDMSPIDKLNPNEEAISSLLNSFNKRRNNNPDAYTDTILLISDDDQPNKIPKLANLGHNTHYNRRYDDRFYPSKFNRKSNNNAGDESPYNDDLLIDSDNTGKLTVLGLASLEDLNLKSSIQRSGNNRKNNHRNFLRLSLSPDNQLTLDEGVASDLSEILSETLDRLNLAPLNLRRTEVTNNKYSRREDNKLSAEEDNINNKPLLRFGNLDNPKAASPLRSNNLVNRNDNNNVRTHGNHRSQEMKKLSPLRSYRKPTSRSSNRNLRTHGNHTRQDLKKLYDEDTAKILVPYHEGKSNKVLNNRKKENQKTNSRDDGFSDEFSLDTLFAFKKESNASDDLTVLPPINQDNLSRETPLLRSFDKILLNDTTNQLHLEFPWNDQMSPGSDKDKPQLRSDGSTTDSTLNLEFPWNDALAPGSDEGKSQLRSDDKKDQTKDTNNNLSLEFPWNDALSPDTSKDKSQLRTDDKEAQSKDSTDNLNLEFPWNDALSPDSSKDKSQLRTDDTEAQSKDSTDNLNLEFPWNDALSPDSSKDKSQLRTDDTEAQSKDSTDNLNLEFPWNDALSPDSSKDKSQLRTDDTEAQSKDSTDNLNLEFPWNDALSPDSSKDKSQLRTDDTEAQSKDSTDNLNLEFPWNDALSPDSSKDKSQLRTDDTEAQSKDSTDNLNLEFPWNDALSPDSSKDKSQLRTDDTEAQSKDSTDNLNLEFPWNDALSPDSSKDKSQLRTDDTEAQSKDSTDNLNLEFPWNDALSPDSSSKDKSQLRTDDKEAQSKDSTDNLNLEFPWNDALSPDSSKDKSQLRTDEKNDENKDTTDTLHLEFPWNDVLSPNSHKSKSQLRSKDDKIDTTDALYLEFPWNDQLSPYKTKRGGPNPQSLLRSQTDNRQDKEPKEELKLEFPWNDKTSSDKPSSKKTTVRIPDPFYIHPYLRSRNVMKHPNYFRRSYDEFKEGTRLENLKNQQSGYHRRQSKRRRNNNLGVIGLSRRSSKDRRRPRLRTKENTRSLVTTTYRPKYTKSLLYRAGRQRDRKTYNDTIIFPNN